MKKGWETKPLAELCEVFADGDWVESKDQSSDGIRLIQTGNVGNGIFKDRAEKARYISEEKFKHLRCTEIFEGDCLISRLPDPVGRSCLLPDTSERMITAVDCTIVRFKRATYLPEFFNLYSQSDEYLATVVNECTGTTRSRISRSNLGLTPIPVPPLSEQQRIVGLLDGAFGGLATAQAHAAQNLQNARDLFESHLQSVFTKRGPGWVEKSLGEVADLLDCLHKTPIYAETGFPMVRVTDIKPGFLDLSKTRKVDEQTFKAFSKGRNPKAGDIVFSRVGSCGVSALVNSDAPFCLGQNTVFILPKINSVLLYHFLNSPNAKQQFEGFIDGTTQPTISMKSIRKVAVPIAPPVEHDGLVAKLDSMREEAQRLESIYQRKLAALAALKKSLLHQAFSGQL